MLNLNEPRVSKFLTAIAEDLDIPPSKYKQAVERYEAVGKWLEGPDSPLHRYRPDIYVQGSFCLGTVIRPLKNGEEADYDIDLVCQLEREKFIGAEYVVKHCVGDRLKDSETYKQMLDKEGSRCWTLQYAEEKDGIGFHLDCLPSVPEDEVTKSQLANAVPNEYAKHAIGITHRNGNGQYEWLGSNPRGYANWFENQNIAAFTRFELAEKTTIFKRAQAIYASVQEVPNGLVRTPLQRVIQILKRHRDHRFAGHCWEKQKPISIIITTLAALAYENETDLLFALRNILRKIEDYALSGLIVEKSGHWQILNPVNPNENFADRWNEAGSKRADAFFQWIRWVRQDLTNALAAGDINGIVDALSESFGSERLEKVAERMESSGIVLQSGGNVPPLADASHALPPEWEVKTKYKVRVKGTVHKEYRQSKVLWDLSRRPVQQDRGLRFRAETNTPGDYEIKWQVVNTGKEAQIAGKPRGGFEEGEGLHGYVRWERTEYAGTHWVEAFVIKDGDCVARSGRRYVRVTG